MPEGHTVHRSAAAVREHLGGRVVAVSSPQGRFEAGAKALDGCRVVDAQAQGKHLLVEFGPPVQAADEDAPPRWLHVHLGLYGGWTWGTGEPPPPRGAVRCRIVTVPEDGQEASWTDLRGPTACEVLDEDGRALLLARLGPDPLRDDADPDAAGEAVRRSRSAIADLLLRQDVVSGVGNVYRAEVLFRARTSPYRQGRDVDAEEWRALWEDLVRLMRAGVRAGRIVTTRPADRPRRGGRVLREDSFYVYRRTGLPCRICGNPVLLDDAGPRRLYWCAHCQAR